MRGGSYLETSDRSVLVAVARGDAIADVAIKGVVLFNVLSATVERVDIGVVGGRIAYVVPDGTGGAGRKTIEGRNRFAVPGLIDGHVHNESSMVTPAQWSKSLLVHGTTAVFTDPHEIANVLGLPGIGYMLAASADLPLRYYVTAPSCVPAVLGVETAGACITPADMQVLLTWDRVVAVAEAMDFPGLIQQTGQITSVAQVAHRCGFGVEGHAPGIVGRRLQAYLVAIGPSGSDHEASLVDEMCEKVRAGMMVYANSSNFVDDSPAIAAALRQVGDQRLFGFCTDDIMPDDLIGCGHLDYGLRRLIAAGVSPMTAFQMATINVAAHYRMPGLGAIAPGWLADIVLLEDVNEVHVDTVIANGEIVVTNGQIAIDIAEPVAPLTVNSVRIPDLSEGDFLRLGGQTGETAYVGMDYSSRYSRRVTIKAVNRDGRLVLPLPPGVAIAAMVPRHGQNSRPSLALLTGFGLQEGAIASTVSHDSHNLVIVGREPRDMLIAAQALVNEGGGFVAVKNGRVLASVPLPIAGLMSAAPVEVVALQIKELLAVLPELGLPRSLPGKLMTLGLSVIPHVRLTDLGLVDVDSQQFIATCALDS